MSSDQGTGSSYWVGAASSFFTVTIVSFTALLCTVGYNAIQRPQLGDANSIAVQKFDAAASATANALLLSTISSIALSLLFAPIGLKQKRKIS